MKKVLFIWIALTIFLCLCACKSDSPSIIGTWNADTSLFSEETGTESKHLIFYDGIEGEETHEKDGTTYKRYQFDYETDGSKLTIYVGNTQTVYTIQYGEANGTDTLQLTAEDGTVYSYTLSSRTLPGLR